jgi:hypothetical protein
MHRNSMMRLASKGFENLPRNAEMIGNVKFKKVSFNEALGFAIPSVRHLNSELGQQCFQELQEVPFLQHIPQILHDENTF